MGSSTDGSNGSGAGSDTGGNGSGSGTQGQPPGALSGHVLDERNDTIDFSSGQPLHTHTGGAVTLSEGSCADVYKYAYLMSVLPPMYGHENAANPITWQVAGGDTNPGQTSYRVRDDANHVLLDWTATTADAQGEYAITLFRDGAHPVTALGTTEGTLHLDVRFHDLHGNEILKQGCWVNHPLAAPLLVDQTGGEVAGMQFQSHSPISHLITSQGAIYMTYQITQQTAEPIKFQLSAPTPSGTVTATVVDTWVNIGSTPVIVGSCDTTNACDKAVVSTSSTPSTAPLTAAWNFVVLDGSDDSTVCSASGLNLSCTIPPRAANQPPHSYRMRLFVGGVKALHVGGPLDPNSEWTAGTWGYTGVAPGALQYNCNGPVLIHGVTYCRNASQFQHIVALDRATIDFGAIAMSFTTYASSTGVVPTYMPSNALALPSWTWNAGDEGLPLEN